jgi:hypothetical protein
MRREVPSGTYVATVKIGSPRTYWSRNSTGVSFVLVISGSDFNGYEIPIRLRERFIDKYWSVSDMNLLADWSEMFDLFGRDILDLLNNCANTTNRSGGILTTILRVEDHYNGVSQYFLTSVRPRQPELQSS